MRLSSKLNGGTVSGPAFWLTPASKKKRPCRKRLWTSRVPAPLLVMISGCGGEQVPGFATGDLRGQVTVVNVFASWCVPCRIEHPLIMLSMVVLTSIVFSLAGFINAIFAKKFDDISIIPTFVLTPLTYLGGVFYSIQLLPEFWQTASLANPVLYMVNAFRYGLLGVSDINLAVALGIILGFILVLGGVSLYLLDRGIGLRT